MSFLNEYLALKKPVYLRENSQAHLLSKEVIPTCKGQLTTLSESILLWKGIDMVGNSNR